MITEVEFDPKLSNLTAYCNRKGVPVAMEKTMSDIFHIKIPNFRQAGKMSSIYNYFMKGRLPLPLIKQNTCKRCYF